MENINKEIITRCQSGDKEAFRIVVKHYQRMVFSLSLKMLEDEEDAKDVTQETFLKVWLKLKEYDFQHPLSTWIYTIASHLCLDRMKKCKRIQPLPEDESFFRAHLTESNAHNQLENKQWVSIVRNLADGLSDKQKLVFTLSHLEGLSSEEIESITNMDATQIKSNLYFARKNIRERLKRLGYV